MTPQLIALWSLHQWPDHCQWVHFGESLFSCVLCCYCGVVDICSPLSTRDTLSLLWRRSPSSHPHPCCRPNLLFTALLRCLVLTRTPPARSPPPTLTLPRPAPQPQSQLRSPILYPCGHTPPQVACPHPPRSRPHHDLPQARRETHSFGRTHATHHGGCRAAGLRGSCSQRPLRYTLSATAGSPLQCSGLLSGPKRRAPAAWMPRGELQR